MGCCCKDDAETTSVQSLPTEDTPTSPVRSHKPQDVFFLLLFLAMLGGMGYLGYYSITEGDPFRYVYGADSWGNVCGRKNTLKIEGVRESAKDHRNRTYEFHTAFSDYRIALNPITYLTKENGPAVICVNKCPAEMTTCQKLLRENGYNISIDVISKRACTMPFNIVLAHTSLLNRCLPSQLLQVGSAIAGVGLQALNPIGSGDASSNNVTEASSDSSLDVFYQLQSAAISVAQFVLTSIAKYWKDTVYLTVIGFGACFFIMVFLQLFTRVIVVLSVIIGGLGTVAVTMYLWYNYAVVKGYIDEDVLAEAVSSSVPAVESLLDFVEERLTFNNETAVMDVEGDARALDTPTNMTSLNITTFDITGLLDSFAFSAIRQSSFLLPGAIILSIISFITVVLLIWIRKSLCLVVKLFDEASLAVCSMPCLLFEPVKTLVAMAIVFAYFFIIAAFILSIGIPSVDTDGLVTFTERNDTPNLSLMAAHIFGCLWMLEFVSACQQLILAGAVCNWFFSRQPDRKKKCKCKCKLCPAARPTLDLMLCSLGTAALGSLIIAIVQFIRITLAYIQSKLKRNESEFTKFMLKCMACCLACFEKILKFINRNAYICAAMYGESFCASGKRAFKLLISNAKHVFALNCVSGFCLFLGKMSVVVVTGFASVGWFRHKLGVHVRATEYLVPTIVACISSYIIALCFFNVYGMAIDTIFMCFCDDQERNNGDDRPYYSSVSLQEYMAEAANSVKKKKRIKSKVNPQESAGVCQSKNKEKEASESKIDYQVVPSPAASHPHCLSRPSNLLINNCWLSQDDDLCSSMTKRWRSRATNSSSSESAKKYLANFNAKELQAPTKHQETKARTPTPYPYNGKKDCCSIAKLPFLPSTPIPGCIYDSHSSENSSDERSIESEQYLLASLSPEPIRKQKKSRRYLLGRLENTSVNGSTSSQGSLSLRRTPSDIMSSTTTPSVLDFHRYSFLQRVKQNASASSLV